MIRPALSGIPGSTERTSSELLAGRVLAVGLPLGTLACTSWVLRRLPRWARPIGEVWLVSTALAGTELVRSAGRVEAGLRVSIDEGRRAVSMIVSRDARALTEAEAVRAAVESVAENTSDAVVAPLVFAAIGGAPLALAFKAVSTLDSMVGYRNDRYLLFGRASALLDDAANYIPARVTALLVLCAERGDWRNNPCPAPAHGAGVGATGAAMECQLCGTSRRRRGPRRRRSVGEDPWSRRPSARAVDRGSLSCAGRAARSARRRQLCVSAPSGTGATGLPDAPARARHPPAGPHTHARYERALGACCGTRVSG